MNEPDFNSLHLFENIPLEIKDEISAEQVRQLVIERNDANEMAEFARTVPIMFDQYKEAIEYANNLLERKKRSSKPGGVWYLGEGGCGKSFILEYILKTNPPHESTFLRKCPILYIVFSSTPTERSILQTLLKQLGQNEQLMAAQSNDKLEETLIHALKVAQTLAILGDEAHHLWLNIKASQASNLIKRIYDQSGVAFVFSGIPTLYQTLSDDPQVSTRWKGVFNLSQFQLGPEFEDVLAALDEAIPMQKISNLDRMAEKIHLITQGNLRNLKDFISEAVFLAATGKSEIILPYLHQACKNTFGQKHANPFDKNESITTPR